jgi:hypothetical protein
MVVPPCPFHVLTGLYCPGCGLTRALSYLLHGHLGLALASNSLAVFMLPVLGYLTLSYIFRRRRQIPATQIDPLLIKFFLAVVILFWVLRNIPASPFIYLAP